MLSQTIPRRWPQSSNRSTTSPVLADKIRSRERTLLIPAYFLPPRRNSNSTGQGCRGSFKLRQALLKDSACLVGELVRDPYQIGRSVVKRSLAAFGIL